METVDNETQLSQSSQESQSFDIPTPGTNIYEGVSSGIANVTAGVINASVPFFRKTYHNFRGNAKSIHKFIRNNLLNTLLRSGVDTRTANRLLNITEAEQLEDIVSNLYKKLDGNINVVLECEELREDAPTMQKNEFDRYMLECIRGNNLPATANRYSQVIDRAFLLHQLILNNITEKEYLNGSVKGQDIVPPNPNARTLFLVQLLLSETGPSYQTSVDDDELYNRYNIYTQQFRSDMSSNPPAVPYDPITGDEARFNPQRQPEPYTVEYGTPLTAAEAQSRIMPNPYPRMKEMELARIAREREKEIAQRKFNKTGKMEKKALKKSNAISFKRTGELGGSKKNKRTMRKKNKRTMRKKNKRTRRRHRK